MALQTFREWPDARRRDRYPFRDTATLASTGGDLILRNEWFLDARLWPEVEDGRVYLSQVAISGTGVAFEIRDGGRRLGAATVGSDRAVFFDNGTQVGFIQLAPGAVNAIRANGEGRYRFSPNGAEFVPTVVSPRVVSGMESLTVGNTVFTDEDVRMVGGEGVELVAGANSIRVNIIGDDLYRRDRCEVPEELGLQINPIRTIRWVDKNTGAQGILSPIRGRIISMIGAQLEAELKRRGFRSPGSTVGTIAERIE